MLHLLPCCLAALLPCCILYIIHQQALRTGWQYCTHKHVSTEEDAHLIDLRMFKQLQRSGFVWGTVGAVGLFSCHILSHPRSSSEAEGGGADCAATRQRESRSEILFLGTGSSLGTPVALHLMNPDLHDQRTFVSRKAAIGDPRHNRNYRCNPCIMVRHRVSENDSSEPIEKNIVVDVGKTFREASVRWFPEHNVQTVDSILLTHGHADAIFGLDDIRNVQSRKEGEPTVPMDVFLSSECLAVVKRVFFYLFPRPLAPGEVPRMVSTVRWQNIQPGVPFQAHSLDVLPFAVKHGEDMESMGFIFGGKNKEKVCYISDISRMLPESLALIRAQGRLELLIIDALAQGYEHPTHYSLEQAVEMCRVLRPQRALLVGMGSQIEHDSTNLELRKLLVSDGLDVQLAHDGLTCQIDL